MKKIIDSSVIEGVRKLGGTIETLLHMQEAYTEAIGNLVRALCNDGQYVILRGCEVFGSGDNYTIQSGCIFFQNEVFDIDAFSGIAPLGEVPTLVIQTTYRLGDPVGYTDGSTHNTHAVRKLAWQFAEPGSGVIELSELSTLKILLNNGLLNVPSQIASVVGLAPISLNTLQKLAAAIGNDPNFSNTVANSIALKVNKAGDTMSGNLTIPAANLAGHAINRGQIFDGIVLKTKVIEIGDWNMDANPSKFTLHGLADWKKVRIKSCVIRDDSDSVRIDLDSTSMDIFGALRTPSERGELTIQPTDVRMYRLNGGDFDNSSYSVTSYNRGWITLVYET